jgi:hypothetical protein
MPVLESLSEHDIRGRRRQRWAADQARPCQGPLTYHAEGFREDLLGQGYTQRSAARQIHLMAHASRWLAARDLEPGDLDDDLAGRFAAARRADGYAVLLSARALAPLLGYLRRLGVARDPADRARTRARCRLIGRFEEYLARERNLAAESIRSYTRVARRFLAETVIGDGAGAGGRDGRRGDRVRPP